MSRYGKSDFSLYSSKLSQKIRFDQLFKHISFQDKSLLDVGAGVGEFYEELLKRNTIPSKYYATEPLNSISDKFKERYPQLPIFTGDIVTDDLEGLDDSFDIIIGVSISAVKLGNTEKSDQYWKQMIEKMYELLADGGMMAINFFSIYKTDVRAEDYVVDPAEMFRFAKRISERVIIDHSYMPQDFMLLIYKGNSEWKSAYKSLSTIDKL